MYDLPFKIDLSGKSVAITGAGGIICGEFTKALAACGAQVALLDINYDAAEKVASEIGENAIAIRCNCLDKESIKSAYSTVISAFGKVDILINGAGGNNPKATCDNETMSPEMLGTEGLKDFFALDESALKFVFDLNITSAFLVTQVFAEGMVKTGGNIINISSKIIQELLAPSEKRNKNQFQELMALLPNDHKAKWFAGAALNASDQSMASVMSTALSRLNAFLDSELEQILCFDTEIDAEKFCSEKSAIFIIMPEEAPTTFFMISLIIQHLYREILAVADEEGGKLKNRCIFFCDEFGTLPKIQDAEMIFSASRSRRLQIVPIIQSFSQLDKNYGKEGEEIIVDNTQLTIFGGFAPNSPSAEVLSKALGTRTVLTGSVNKGKNDPSESLQMTERPLMSADELKAMPKGQFVVMKTGAHPMKVRLKLFFDWGISFGEPYTVKENANRKVEYAEKKEVVEKIVEKYCPDLKDETEEKSKTRGGIGGQSQVESRRHFEPERKTDKPFLRTSSVKRQLPLPPSLTEEERGENEPT